MKFYTINIKYYGVEFHKTFSVPVDMKEFLDKYYHKLNNSNSKMYARCPRRINVKNYVVIFERDTFTYAQNVCKEDIDYGKIIIFGDDSVNGYNFYDKYNDFNQLIN